MSAKHLIIADSQKERDDNVQAMWLSWCRLCAKQELNEEECSSIFAENGNGKFGSELATSVGKYFWVNIKPDDDISQCLCWQCKQLVEELVTFTERVNKVQTLFCLLQNIKPTTLQQANKLRTQCGLVDEEWEHIIRPLSANIDECAKPLLIDQPVQQDLLTCADKEKQQYSDMETATETEQIINILSNSDEDEVFESQAVTEVENVYEYVVEAANEIEFVDNKDYIMPSNNDCNEDNSTINTQDVGEQENVEDSDLFKEFKFKIGVNEDDEQKEEKIKITSDEERLEAEYQESTQSIEQVEEDVEQSLEMLEEAVEDEDYDRVTENQNERRTTVIGLGKGKRGRPFGTKNSQTDVSPCSFECKECKRTYKNPNIFRRHMSSLHNVLVDDMPEFKSKSNICPVCSKQFLTRSSLKLHMRHHLPDEEKYNVPCPYCERKFSQVGAMRQHVNGIHHQMKPFICDQCGRACKTMAALTEHQLVHTNECPFECEVCHKKFKNKPRLKSHMDIHDKSAYSCPDCGLELNTKRTLLQHRLVHSDIKRFKCEFCDAAFKRSKALKNHLILHSGLRPYKCNFCNKSFSNGSNCRAHKKRSHPRELAEEEANGIEPERVPIPKLEELKSAKGALVQPRKIKRHAGGLPNHLRRLLQSAEENKQEDSNDYEESTENYESLSDFHYEICKSEMDDTESMLDNANEQCEETVIYEIIDEI